ncbi:MAG: DNA ligase [Alteromonadales bacterium]|nr:DNA ligase [Alteromonadales bacterium]
MKANLCLSMLLYVALNRGYAQDTQPIKATPNIQHGIAYIKNYHSKAVLPITQYFVSEKLDGMRGYWDGRQLLTRNGNLIASPKWFTRNWPTVEIDGELWISRNTFQDLISCVRKKIPEKCWHQVRFMIFDLPNSKAVFSVRVVQMQRLEKQINSLYFKVIAQRKLVSMSELDALLTNITHKHGEGLMLHHENAPYVVGRNPALLKLKKHQDAEATVIGYIKGKGKYKHTLGSLKVKNSKGVVFKVGSGLSEKDRKNPPHIGSVITYKYNGLTKAGKPRFARYWRARTLEK